MNRGTRLLGIITVQITEGQLHGLPGDQGEFDWERLVDTQWHLQIEHVNRDGAHYRQRQVADARRQGGKSADLG